MTVHTYCFGFKFREKKKKKKRKKKIVRDPLGVRNLPIQKKKK